MTTPITLARCVGTRREEITLESYTTEVCYLGGHGYVTLYTDARTGLSYGDHRWSVSAEAPNAPAAPRQHRSPRRALSRDEIGNARGHRLHVLVGVWASNNRDCRRHEDIVSAWLGERVTSFARLTEAQYRSVRDTLDSYMIPA